MAKLSVVDMTGKSVGELDLKADVFEVDYNEALIHQIYVGLKANQRRGTADTKTRGEIRGGGRKPWKQKGTGNARQGSRRAPHWKGGGVVFGPHPRSYVQALPKNMRHAALRSALSQRLRESNFTALSTISLSEIKTKKIIEMLVSVTKNAHSSTKFEDRSVILLAQTDHNVIKAAANIPGVQVKTVNQFNLLDVIDNQRILATQDAIRHLEETLS